MTEKTLLCDENDMDQFVQILKTMDKFDFLPGLLEVEPNLGIAIVRPELGQNDTASMPRALSVMPLTQDAYDSFMARVPESIMHEADFFKLGQVSFIYESYISHDLFEFYESLCHEQIEKKAEEGSLAMPMYEISEDLFMQTLPEAGSVELLISSDTKAEDVVSFFKSNNFMISEDEQKDIVAGTVIPIRKESEVYAGLQSFTGWDDLFSAVIEKSQNDVNPFCLFEKGVFRPLSNLEYRQLIAQAAKDQGIEMSTQDKELLFGVRSLKEMAEGVGSGVQNPAVDVAPTYDYTSYNKPTPKDFSLEAWEPPITNTH